MSEAVTPKQQGEVDNRELFKIIVENFLALTMIGGFGGYLLDAAGLYQVTAHSVVNVVVTGMIWGMYGAGKSVVRERDDVQVPDPVRIVLDRIGLDSETRRRLLKNHFHIGIPAPRCTR